MMLGKLGEKWGRKPVKELDILWLLFRTIPLGSQDTSGLTPSVIKVGPGRALKNV